MQLLALKSVILKLCLLFTRLDLWLSWKKWHWQNAHNITLITLCLFFLRKTYLLLLFTLSPTVTIIVTSAIKADTVVQATPVADITPVVVVVEKDDHIIINKGHGISPLHNRHVSILLGLYNGCHGLIILAHILQLGIRSNQSLQTINSTFLGRNHNRHMSLQHIRHIHQHIFGMEFIIYMTPPDDQWYMNT